MRDTIYRDEAIEAVAEDLASVLNVSKDETRELAEHALSALPSAEAVKVAYICDGRKCDSDCSECFRTTDIEHAKDFELVGDTYFQQPSAEAKPTIIRSKALMPAKDFKEWVKRIRETNPNAVVIPCDAEVASAEAVQGDAISKRFISDAVLQKISELNAQGEKAIPIAREFIRFKRFVDGITPIRAETVQGWIPCSERLPKVNQRVLLATNDGRVFVGYREKPDLVWQVTEKDGRKHWVYDPENYTDDIEILPKNEDCGFSKDDVYSDGFLSVASVNYDDRFVGVTAWMPLPKPYKGGDDE